MGYEFCVSVNKDHHKYKRENKFSLLPSKIQFFIEGAISEQGHETLIPLSFSVSPVHVRLKIVLEEEFHLKTTSKYQKWNISATTDWMFLKFET